MTVGGRIEHVTDQDPFPDLFHAALSNEGGVTAVQFNRPNWPHTTSAVVRITASSKEDAEDQAQEIFVRVFSSVAHDISGDAPYGWVISVDAKPVSDVSS